MQQFKFHMLNHLACWFGQYYFSIWCRSSSSTSFRCDTFLKNDRARKHLLHVFVDVIFKFSHFVAQWFDLIFESKSYACYFLSTLFNLGLFFLTIFFDHIVSTDMSSFHLLIVITSARIEDDELLRNDFFFDAVEARHFFLRSSWASTSIDIFNLLTI